MLGKRIRPAMPQRGGRANGCAFGPGHVYACLCTVCEMLNVVTEQERVSGSDSTSRGMWGRLMMGLGG